MIPSMPGTNLTRDEAQARAQLLEVDSYRVELDLTCGGKPMVELAADVDDSATPAPGLDTGSQMGKRYTTEDESGLELLVTKAGDGTLAAGDIPLVLKDAKPLPSSD